MPPVSAPSLTATEEDAGAESLGGLRAEIDRLDEALHETLMRRAEVVGRLAGLQAKGRVALRPGREAAVLRGLLARHRGAFPRASLVRMWREMMCGMTALQRPLLVVVGARDVAPYVAAAREQFGALAPIRAHHTPAQAIREVSGGAATAAVLPMPREDEAAGEAWWTALLQADDPRIHVVARLPFWSARPEGAPAVQALVASAAAPDPSGADRSLLGLELAAETSRARLGRALAEAGFEAGSVILRREGDAATALVDVEGFVDEADGRLRRLGAITRPAVVLGAYAVPV